MGDAERRLEVTLAIAGWDYLSFRSYTFRAGQVVAGESAADEMAMVLLSGAVTIEVAGPGWGETWECRGREEVFAGTPFAIYLPPGHTYRTTVHADADCAYGRAPADGTRPPRLVRPEDVAAETDGAGNRTTRILNPEDTEHLLCAETIVEGGRWQGLPPHQDKVPAAGERDREEVTYYRMQPADGWALQRIFTDDDAVDEALTVHHADATIARPGEHHPVVAAPGTLVYALRFLAGPDVGWPR
ncbi:MAG: 5-deoxy-glucuronate isomerase [Chloroflexia bacterium]|nr:5-deoxy-glucuronate isomerase [Chloroflexia bacterium]